MTVLTNLALWTIYDHPSDYPDFYVARLFLDGKPTAHALTSISLGYLRQLLLTSDPNLIRCERHPSDDPVIVETWF